MTALDIGTPVRLVAHPSAPPLVVSRLYLQGSPEVLWAGCSWRKGAQEVHFPVSEMEATP